MTSERPLSREEEDEVQGYLRAGIQLIGVAPNADSAEVIAAIDAFVDEWPRRDAAVVEIDLSRSERVIDLSWALGALWGDHLIRELHWEWTVVIQDSSERYGVVSRDRALAVYPSYFVRECLYDAGRDFTAMLIFNMLLDGRFNSWPPKAFADLSESAIRIVPRR